MEFIKLSTVVFHLPSYGENAHIRNTRKREIEEEWLTWVYGENACYSGVSV